MIAATDFAGLFGWSLRIETGPAVAGFGGCLAAVAVEVGIAGQVTHNTLRRLNYLAN